MFVSSFLVNAEASGPNGWTPIRGCFVYGVSTRIIRTVSSLPFISTLIVSPSTTLLTTAGIVLVGKWVEELISEEDLRPLLGISYVSWLVFVTEFSSAVLQPVTIKLLKNRHKHKTNNLCLVFHVEIIITPYSHCFFLSGIKIVS